MKFVEFEDLFYTIQTTDYILEFPLDLLPLEEERGVCLVWNNYVDVVKPLDYVGVENFYPIEDLDHAKRKILRKAAELSLRYINSLNEFKIENLLKANSLKHIKDRYLYCRYNNGILCVPEEWFFVGIYRERFGLLSLDLDKVFYFKEYENNVR